jgi:hypothetical protein
MPIIRLSKLSYSFSATRTLMAACLIAVISIFMSASATPATAERMQAAGSRVSIDLPDNFQSSPLFAGFMEIISSAAVIMLELPADDYDRVVAGFTAEALAKKSVTNVKVGKLDRTDSYYFVTGEQEHPRAVFEKFILVIKDPRNTAVITFNVPKGSFTNASIKREAVIKALTTAKLEEKAKPAKELFHLGYVGPYILNGQPTGTSRIYVEKNASEPKGTQNLMVIAPSLNRLPVKNIKEFAEYAMTSMKTIKDLATTSAKDVRIDNMTGHLITATGMRGASQLPVTIRQLILLPSKGGYYRLLTVNKTADDARLAPEIEKIFASFKSVGELQAQ